MPSDFEDEEIDEELAFTKEDKKKFGSWFGKEVSSEDGEAVAIGDDDGEDLDSGDGTVEDEEGENPVKLVANRGRGHQRAGTQDRDEGIDDILFDDDDDNPFSDDEAGDMNVHDEDEEERHRCAARTVQPCLSIHLPSLTQFVLPHSSIDFSLCPLLLP